MRKSGHGELCDLIFCKFMPILNISCPLLDLIPESSRFVSYDPEGQESNDETVLSFCQSAFAIKVPYIAFGVVIYSAFHPSVDRVYSTRGPAHFIGGERKKRSVG